MFSEQDRPGHGRSLFIRRVAHMLATARNPKRQATSRRRNNKFLQLLPTIRGQAEYAFRRVPVEAREELIQEVVAQAYALFVRLASGADWLSCLQRHLPDSQSVMSARGGDSARGEAAGKLCHRVRA